jgi:uncharacterized SAM-binding protein YcdF (DUF218 family)
MFLAKKIIAALVLPPMSLLLLAFIGLWLVLRNKGRQRTFGVVLLSLSLAALVALSLPAVGDRLLQSLEKHPPISPRQLAEAQAIVILGGGLYHDAPEYGSDTVGDSTLQRVRYGARLARATKLPVLVTGGTPRGGIPEAQAMREVLGSEFGVRVQWTESASRDTAENARFSAAQLKAAGISRIALVSHGWHLPRAKLLFEREGITVYAAPTAFSTPSGDALSDWLPDDFRDSRIAAHEYLGKTVDALRLLF